MIHTGELSQPHPDIELGLPRAPVRFRYALPDTEKQGVGLIFYIHGYGGAFNDPYTDSLLPFLAKKYQCIAVAVDYFGAETYGPCDIEPSDDFVAQVAAIYKAQVPPELDEKLMPQWFSWVIKTLAAAGATVLDPRVNIVRKVNGYNSFGLLPAMDHLEVLLHMLQHFSIDSHRIFVIGTSYGGYIALLLAKLAPKTFRMIVDNSGFTSAADDMNAVYGWIGSPVMGVMIRGRSLIHWDETQNSPRYFADSNAAIRDLLREDHLTETSLRVYSFHSCKDKVTPVERKKSMISLWKQKIPAQLTVIGPEDVDGVVIKNLDHGMNASIRGLFERAYSDFINAPPAPATGTDFDHQTKKRFACGDKEYLISFARHEVRIAIIPANSAATG